MPTYDFTCEKCKKNFTLTMTMQERDRKKPKCPKCNSTRVRQRLTGFQRQLGHFALPAGKQPAIAFGQHQLEPVRAPAAGQAADVTVGAEPHARPGREKAVLRQKQASGHC